MNTSDTERPRGPHGMCKLVASACRHHLVPKRFRSRSGRVLLPTAGASSSPAPKSAWAEFLLYGRRPADADEGASEGGMRRGDGGEGAGGPRRWLPRRSVLLLIGVPAMVLMAAAVLRLLAIFSVVELLFSMLESLVTHHETPGLTRSLEMRSDDERLMSHIATVRGVFVAPVI